MGSAEKRKKRERAKKKQIAKMKQTRLSSSHQPPNPARSIRYQLKTPELLIAAGPLILGTWAVPPALAAALQAAGRPAPPLVQGALLVDTGASGTCISEAAAQALGVRAVRTMQTYGASGLHSNNIYEVFLNIAIEDTERGVRSDINFNLQAIGVPDLEKQLSNLEVGGQPIQLVGLLGRDFLRHTIMTYRGGAASFEIVIDRGLFEVKPAV